MSAWNGEHVTKCVKTRSEVTSVNVNLDTNWKVTDAHAKQKVSAFSLKMFRGDMIPDLFFPKFG